MKVYLKKAVSALVIFCLQSPVWAQSVPVTTQTDWSQATFGDKSPTKPKLPVMKGPLIDEMTQICFEKRDLGLVPGAVDGLAASEMPDMASSKLKEQKAKSYFLDQTVNNTLSNLYLKTGSSGRSQRIVQKILDDHGCDGSKVQNMDMQGWVKSRPDFNASNLNVIMSVKGLAGINDLSHNKVGSYSALLDMYQDSKQVSDADINMAYGKWKNFGYNTQCGSAMSSIDNMCNGTLNAKDTFDAILAKRDPTQSFGPLTPVVVWIAANPGTAIAVGSLIVTTIGTAVNVGMAVHNANSVSPADAKEAKMEQLRTEETQYKNELELHQNELEEFKKTHPKTDDPVTNNINEDKQKELESNVTKTEEKIKKNSDEQYITSGKRPEDKSNDNGKNDIEYELALQNFIEGEWKTLQRELAQSFRSCNADVSSNVSETVENYTPRGETCDVDGALSDLIKITELNENEDPNYGSHPDLGKSVADNVNSAMVGFVECTPMAPGDGCQQRMDEHFRNHGFDGGMAEFCVVMPASFCNAGKAHWFPEENMKKGAEKDQPVTEGGMAFGGGAIDLNKNFGIEMGKPETPEDIGKKMLEDVLKKTEEQKANALPPPDYDPYSLNFFEQKKKREEAHERYCTNFPFDEDNCEEKYRTRLSPGEWMKKWKEHQERQLMKAAGF